MKETPILFTAEMVCAILNGYKTQTRRIVMPIPVLEGNLWRYKLPRLGVDINLTDHPDLALRYCPYGGPGDFLWVRETWAAAKAYDHLPPSRIPKRGRERVWYLADGAKPKWAGRTRVSIHMPRWASRLLLELTARSIATVQQISEADAKAEGVAKKYKMPAWAPREATDQFRDLWDSINAGRNLGWAVNPWVWTLTFGKAS